MDLGGRRGRDNPGGTRGGETLIRIYCVKKVLYKIKIGKNFPVGTLHYGELCERNQL